MNVKAIILKCPTMEKLQLSIDDALTNTYRVRKFLEKVALTASLGGKEF